MGINFRNSSQSNPQSRSRNRSQSALSSKRHVTFATDSDDLKFHPQAPVPQSRPSLITYCLLLAVLLLLHLWNLSLALLNHLFYRPWSFNSQDPPLPELVRNLSQPSKIPYHLALVFAPFDSRRRLTLGLSWKWKRESLEEIKERRIVEMSRDISRLIVWSQILGVERLSVYDRDGILRDRPSLLVDCLCSHVDNFVVTSSYLMASPPSFQISYLPPADVPTAELSIANAPFANVPSTNAPLTNAQPLKVTILASMDGKEHMVKVAKSLGEASRKGLVHPNEITIDNLQEKLYSSLIPDIDLLIVLGGPHLRLYDFPPWQIRLSEIFHEPSLNLLGPAKLSYKTFAKALEAFNRTQQRHGR